MSAADSLYLPGSDGSRDGEPVAVGDTPIAPVALQDRTFAGLPIPTLILAAIVLLLGLLSAWQTREILALRSHRMVSVSLATIVRDFIATEAHNGGTPETSAMRTKLYLAATQASIRELTEQGTTVLVSEAVAGNSVPDVTPALKANIDAKLKAVQISAAGR
ncbi:TrbI F-type domain-containing protein [Glacieibacterium megasporae]|uniref:TrbI F-type domain-containing protein n=1 Tax=Glacieibacterium megasporae TaxID=2835787 RepID=UPI001C1E3198|nr:TrbI F-type domain-containing protein [Polymorphobacter megasporae]UAJ12386.1 type-F conjugative transfer system protein TrbI [Polymorphobacter megasporae]